MGTCGNIYHAYAVLASNIYRKDVAKLNVNTILQTTRRISRRSLHQGQFYFEQLPLGLCSTADHFQQLPSVVAQNAEGPVKLSDVYLYLACVGRNTP